MRYRRPQSSHHHHHHQRRTIRTMWIHRTSPSLFVLLILTLTLSKPAVSSQQNTRPVSVPDNIEFKQDNDQQQQPIGSSGGGSRIQEATTTSSSSEHLRSSDINAAIERFEAAVESRTTEPENENKIASDLTSQANRTTPTTLTSNQISGGNGEQTGQPLTSTSRQHTRKLIRSRYRLRAHKEPPSTIGSDGGSGQQQQQLTSTISNYSQPFDLNAQQIQQQQQQQPPTGNGDLNHYDGYHHQLARALSPLSSAAPTSSSSSSSFLSDSVPAPYTYLAGPPQRAPSSGGPALLSSASDGTNAASLSSNDDQSSSFSGQQDNGAAAVNSYVPSYTTNHLAASSRMYPASNEAIMNQHHHRFRAFGGASSAAAAAADLPPYYLAAAPSAQAPTTASGTGTGAGPTTTTTTTTHGDYFAGGSSGPSSQLSSSSSVNSQSSYHSPNEQYDHYVPRNYSENQLDFASGHLAPPMLDYWASPAVWHSAAAASPRSRWSWPWTDVSSLNGYGGGVGGGGGAGLATTGTSMGLGGDYNMGPMNTAATFKKHHHHHHHHLQQHKDHEPHHHHHEEHEHLMPKWEHAISFGEIACIAVAVVLGIIILGSPFFLLFLMLFNGGNLFGATQMGLLAPATVQGAATTAAGRRKRRSIGLPEKSSREEVKKETHQRPANGLKAASELINMGEHLFERLSPYMDADKLMRSFERIMNVKDDFENIVAKLGLQDHMKDVKWPTTTSTTTTTTTGHKTTDTGEQPVVAANLHQHVEMRRRRKK